MDQHAYISLKAIILLIFGLSALSRAISIFFQSKASSTLCNIFAIYDYESGSQISFLDTKKLFLVVELFLIILVSWESTAILAGYLAIIYFLLPSILFRYATKSLPFNLFYRNILIGFFSIALLFKFPHQEFGWMNYYSMFLMTSVATGTYALMNWILFQYNVDSNRVETA